MHPFPETLPCHTKYEALSYEWGDQSNKAQILVDPSKLDVTRNRETALRDLRYEQTSRTMWIDAICVDQRNLDERNKQVSHTKSVYRHADQVLM